MIIARWKERYKSTKINAKNVDLLYIDNWAIDLYFKRILGKVFFSTVCVWNPKRI